MEKIKIKLLFLFIIATTINSINVPNVLSGYVNI
jgi:hypothetical protein